MVFTDPRFLPFFLIVLGLYWAFRSDRWRKPMLLVASYAFYSVWDWRFSGLLAASTLIDFWIGIKIAADPAVSHKKRWLLISIVANLTFLGFFKYFNFFVDSAVNLCALFDVHISAMTFRVLLPPGISFYTFMSLGYTIDVYRGRLEPRRNLLDYAVFVAFFPHLVAGPILRAVDFLKQLDAPREWNRYFPVKTAVTLLLVGFVKKACIADHVAPIVEHVFDHPDACPAIDHWLGLCLYSVQLYCDFSGYTDIAIGCAGLLGYTLCPNFEFPYFSKNMRQFWRRWHMSMSSWFYDYVYLPLGGNRGTKARAAFNLLTSFTLCGLWHGPAWHYVAFGLMHGLYLLGINAYDRVVPEQSRLARMIGILAPLLTTFFLYMSYVLFRCSNWTDIGTMYQHLFGFGPDRRVRLDQAWWLVFAGLAVVHWFSYRGVWAALGRRVPTLVWWFGYGGAWAAAISFASTDYKPFVYFQF